MKSRFAKKKDANHSQIKKIFSSNGFFVHDISNLDNCCDIIVAFNNIVAYIEIKDGDKPPSQRVLTSGEAKFKDAVHGYAYWYLCTSKDDADTIMMELKKRSIL